MKLLTDRSVHAEENKIRRLSLAYIFSPGALLLCFRCGLAPKCVHLVVFPIFDLEPAELYHHRVSKCGCHQEVDVARFLFRPIPNHLLAHYMLYYLLLFLIRDYFLYNRLKSLSRQVVLFSSSLFKSFTVLMHDHDIFAG